MNPLKFYTLLALSVLTMAATVAVIMLSRTNGQMQTAMAAKQEDINKGGTSQQYFSSMVRDIAQAAQADQKLRDVLIRNGFTLRSGTDAAATASPTP